MDLAKPYRAESAIIHAECSNSPLVILRGLGQAGRSRMGRLLRPVLYAVGYVNVVTLWVAAADKLIWPSRTGFW